jgi:hypothetical protein
MMSHKIDLKKTFAIIGTALIFLAVLFSCANTIPKPIVAHYSFEYKNQTYRIRSISSKNGEESLNELIGRNFMAVDLNQDRIVDRIIIGDAPLSKVQEIYEYGLNLLSQQGKLAEHKGDANHYVVAESCCVFEIKGFQIKNANPFNEFIVNENPNTNQSLIMVGIDQNADGMLDILVKGKTTLERLQHQYEETLRKGLAGNKIRKSQGQYIVK